MSRRDKFHDAVRHALEKEGWTISHDPLPLKIGNLKLEVDLGAEKLIGAQKDNQKIAVEVKSFLKTSKITEFYHAFGQFFPYKVALQQLEPDRILYLAVPDYIYEALFNEILIKSLLEQYPIKLIVYMADREEIQTWIN
ncbi:element excision factor XisH family protein [Chamaesiphon sp. VAR_48_metabat_135_sub]|uniref:element excision factor XisH family protein n=1 Tax=Chamaesiphon sp. VAR_48_metabat_135_sub TaxID=2964699 RepID=UPI00286CE3C9|nr:element excision factor XisH family protein [Chamaesiphon sp. VAR_48_metabat_135_sub]